MRREREAVSRKPPLAKRGPKPAPKKRRPGADRVMEAQAAGRAAFLERSALEPETVEKLDRYVALLTEWQRRINLVAPATIGDVWHRHIADSLELASLLPSFARLADLGTGAGLPGIPIAIARPDAHIDLVESNGKKAAFLRAAVRELDLDASVYAERIETSGAVIGEAEVVTARALAPLGDLIGLVEPHLKPGATCFFMKGIAHEQEILAASAQWRFEVVKHDSSLTDGSVVLALSDLSPA